MSELQSLSDEQLMTLRSSLAQTGQTQAAPAPSPVQVQALPPVPGARVDPTYNLDLSRLTPEQLQALQANANPNMSTGEDVARSGVTGLERGGFGIGAIPGNLANLEGTAVEWAGHHGIGALQDFTGSSLGAPYMGAGTKFKPDGTNYAHASGLPDQSNADALAQRLLGPFHQPQTTPGRYAERVGEFAPAAGLGGGGVVGRTAAVVTPAVGSRLLEDVAPENLKPWASVLGAVVGGGLNGGADLIANAPRKLLADAARDFAPSTISDAVNLQRKAAGLGVQITPFEALDQVTNGGAKSATALQHFAENSPYGRRITAPIFADRPAQMNAAVNRVADLIAPTDIGPSASALAAQTGAEGVLRKFDQMRTGLTRPLYKAADAQTVDAAHIEDLRDALTAEIMSDRTGKIAPVLKAFRDDLAPAGSALTDIKSLDTIRKIYRDKFDLPPNSPDALGKTQAATLRPFVEQLDGLMERSSPTFEQAKGLHSQLSRDVVDPANAGPLGTIANTSDLPSQVGALYPRSPPEGAARETAVAARLLPQDVAANLTRHNLIDTWNQANTDLQPGQNQWAGARLAKAIAGHDEQAAALNAGVGAVDPSGQIAQHLASLLETGRATGKRWAPGSLTQFNAEQAKAFGMSPAPVRTVGALLDPLEWGKSFDRAVGGALYKRNVQTIARVLKMSPDEAATVLHKAKADKSTNPLVAALLLSSSPAEDSAP